MKILVQWASLNPSDYEEINSADWSDLPSGRRIQSVNIQGVNFDSFEEYALEEIAGGGVNLYAWHPPRPDYPNEEMTESHGHKWTFLPLARDRRLGGAINTRQRKHTFYEPTDQRIWDQPLAAIETRSTFAEFRMPSALVKRGVATDFGAAGYLSEQIHMESRRAMGWRYWTEGLPGDEIIDGLLRPQRAAGRWSKAEGTITYFQRDTDRASSVHTTVANKDALELGTASLVDETATVPMGGSLFAWLFTTPANEPNSADWPNGLYRIQLDVATSSNPFDYGFRTLDSLDGHMGRVNAALTSDEETWTQTQGAFSGTGLKLASRTINPSSGAASDRFEGLLVWFDTCGCGGTVRLDLNISDSFADGPWTTAVTVQRTFLGAISSGNLTGALAKKPLIDRGGVISTLTGDLTKKPAATFEGVDTPTGLVNKKPLVTFEGSDTPTGVLTTIRKALISIAGAIATITGALAKKPLIARGGALASSGALAHKPLIVRTGSDTPTGALTKKPSVTFEGADTPTGTLSNLQKIILLVAGTITSAGALVKQARIVRTGSDTPIGSLSKQAQVTFEGSDTPTGALANIKKILESMAGVVSVITGAVSLKVLKALAGSDTPTGSLDQKPAVTFEGSDTPTGALDKKPAVTFEGTVASAGALSTLTKIVLLVAGTISSAGALTKKAFVSIGSGTVTSSGVLNKKPGVTFEGTVTSAGTLTTLKMILLAIAGTLTSAGALAKKALLSRGGIVAPSGILNKIPKTTFEGTVTSAGGLFKKVLKSLVGVLTSAGALATVVVSGTEAPLVRAFRGATQTIFSRKNLDDFSGGTEDSFDRKVF